MPALLSRFFLIPIWYPGKGGEILTTDGTDETDDENDEIQMMKQRPEARE
jgi:hypothetical protein